MLLVCVCVETAMSWPSLSAMRSRDRVLVLFADRADDPSLVGQRAVAREAGFRERDLKMVTVVGDAVDGASDDSAALRHRFGASSGFHAALVGKDGGTKLDRAAPISAAELFETIDAMPMRRHEIRRR